jgi:hypothetical protein
MSYYRRAMAVGNEAPGLARQVPGGSVPAYPAWALVGTEQRYDVIGDLPSEAPARARLRLVTCFLPAPRAGRAPPADRAAVLAVAGLQMALPARYRLQPGWVVPAGQLELQRDWQY